MLKKTMGLLTLCLMLLPVVGSTVQAQSLKVGYTEAEAFLQFMPEAEQIQKTLQQEAQTSQQDLQDMLQGFQEKLDRYQKQQALLSDERRAEREQELQQLQVQLQQAEAQSQQKLAQREAQLVNPLLQRIQQAIDDVAKEKGLDIVLRSPVLLYVDESKITDISMDVARKLGIDVSEAQLSEQGSN